jgi:hypothetical protein
MEILMSVFGGFGVGLFIGWLYLRDLDKSLGKTVSYYKETVDIWMGLTKKAIAEAEFWKMQYDDVAQDSEDMVGGEEETTWH